MSDYVKKKVIRLPFPENLINKLEVDSCWDCEVYIKEKFGFDLWDKRPGGFEIDCTEKRNYLDYVVDYEYGSEVGDWGYAWYLNEEDINKYKPLFDKGEFEYDPKDLRKVAYCWYNCSEAPDYYEPNDITFENI